MSATSMDRAWFLCTAAAISGLSAPYAALELRIVTGGGHAA